jgi:hypothetical protein
MDAASELPTDVLAFVEDQVDSVPHLEALLLLWKSAPDPWTASQIAARIYVGQDAATEILGDLTRRKLARTIDEGAGSFAYDPAWDRSGDLMERVAAAYRQNLILVAHTIHAKASGAVREFARAFEIKKDG